MGLAQRSEKNANAPLASSTGPDGGAPSLDFELDGVKGSLQQVNGAVVGGDDEIAVGPLRIFVSADEEFEGEAFEHGVVD